QILNEDTTYGYLQRQAVARLQDVRKLAQSTRLNRERILPLGGNRFMLLPWHGTYEFETLSLLIKRSPALLKVADKDSRSPFYMELIFTNDNIRDLVNTLHNILLDPPTTNQL